MSEAVSDIRAVVRDEALTVPDTIRSAAQLATIVVVTAAAALIAASTDSVLVWAMCWFALAWFFVSCALIVHETAHGHLFGSRTLDRVIGNLAAALTLTAWGTYRAYHVEHHRATAGPDDPEGGPYAFPTRLTYVLALTIGGPALVLQMLYFTVVSVSGRGPRWVRTAAQRRDIVISFLVQVAMLGCLLGAWFVRADLVVRLFVIPYLIAAMVLLPFLLYPEHAGGQASDDPLRNTRSVRSNPVLRFWYWNGNFHTEHHAIPSVTYRNLPRLADAIATEQEPVWRNRSYTEFHLQQLRALPLVRRRSAPEPVV